jgi:hypothetical protein
LEGGEECCAKDGIGRTAGQRCSRVLLDSAGAHKLLRFIMRLVGVPVAGASARLVCRLD